MKIDNGMPSVYVTGRQQRAAADDDAYRGAEQQRAVPRGFTPSVSPAVAVSSAFANALWQAGIGLEKAPADTLAEEFMELARMSPVERLRKEMLEKLNLTEESLKALPADEREAIEEDIRRAIEEQLGIADGTGAAGLRGAVTKGEAEA